MQKGNNNKDEIQYMRTWLLLRQTHQSLVQHLKTKLQDETKYYTEIGRKKHNNNTTFNKITLTQRQNYVSVLLCCNSKFRENNNSNRYLQRL